MVATGALSAIGGRIITIITMLHCLYFRFRSGPLAQIRYNKRATSCTPKGW